jgi:branched-chain amino acid transport system substrate-binding protein
VNAPVLGGDAYDDPALHQALGEKFGNDVYFVTHTWIGPGAGPEMQHFLGLYRDMYKKDPDTSFVATGYDTVMMMAQAVKAAGSTDGAAVAKALEDGQFKLLTGDLDYGTAEEGHVPNKAAAVIQLTGGKPSFVGWRHPQSIPAP